MSALLASANTRRIKASHRRRRKIASGRFVQRYMDAELGRFLTPDPVGPEEDFIKHFNRYNYAMNNPVRYTDPDGRRPGGCQSGTCDKSTKQIEEENQHSKDMREAGNVTTAVTSIPSALSRIMKEGIITTETASTIKSLSKAGARLSALGSVAEFSIGVAENDNNAVAHGTTTFTIGIVGSIVAPQATAVVLLIDAGVQNVTFQKSNGEIVSGWEAVGNYLPNNTLQTECKACW